MHSPGFIAGVLGVGIAVLSGCTSGTAPSSGSMAEVAAAFASPSDTTRTKVWWFHGETETTREGITADLEAYRQAGVGGVVYYDQVHNNSTPDAFEALSPDWWEMLLFAAQEAERLGLTFECHVSNGYVAGGPWITPDKGMQRLAVTDTVLQGGSRVEVALPRPISTYYKDVAVLTFPSTGIWQEESCRELPLVSSNIPSFDAKAVFVPGKKLVSIPVQEAGKSVYLTLDFGHAFTARSLTYQTAPRGKATTSATNVPGPPGDTFVGTGYQELPPLGQLEVSDDGIHYRPVCDIQPIYKAHSSWRQKTVAFPTVTARYFRLNLHDWQAPDISPGLQLGDVTLSARACVDLWEEKSGLYSEYVSPDRTPSYEATEVIDPSSLVDLTSCLDAEGVLRWDAPAGEWVVLRFVHLPTGSKTKHGRPNLMGLECDKMSAEAAECQWQHYFGAIADTLKRHGIALQGMAMDSHEAGSQNWTPGFEQEFARRRGYDMLRYLPVMAGYVVGSSRESDAFLYDVRRTIADLISDNYYATFDRLCRARGFDFTAQATGNALCIVADPIQAKGRVLKPQGEFWAIHPDGNYDIKESSSAAHLYGKTVASGEAFTDAHFSHSLAYLKQLADYAYCFGLNEFVVCASAYQPWLDRIPGNTGGGRHYCLQRNNPFWAYSRGFWDYQARCAYVMRQGRPVVDLAVYLGENAPVKILTYRLPDIPSGYDFDAFTSDALFSRMEVRDGLLTLPDGMSYRLMILPRSGEITFAAFQKIATLVAGGMPVYGPRPTGSPTREDMGREADYQALVSALWGAEASLQGKRTYGKGTVYWGMPLEDVLACIDLPPDVEEKAGDVKADKLYFSHRRLSDADIYFLDNHTDRAVSDTFTFRTRWYTAERWNPVNGERCRLSSSSPDTLYPSLALQLAPRESYFVVFSAEVSETLPSVVWPGEGREEVISGDWRVYFDPAWGGPGEVLFPTLDDWTTHPQPEIRYYSGTAVYQNRFSVHRTSPDERLYVKITCLNGAIRVVVNGREAGTVWCSPWELEITSAVQEGENAIEFQVVNSLMNRMIGDASLPVDERFTYAYPEIASADDPLVPSGLIGQVWLEYR